MHIDLNSCFATIEQQANPLLRGKPIVVAAYTTPNAIVLAPSIEAKPLGIKLGMRVREARMICKNVVVLPPDPPKYRAVHVAFRRIFEDYSPSVVPKSIDEAIIDFTHTIAIFKHPLTNIALEIKARIKEEIGEWMSASIGIAPNRFLAKLGASLHKPNGLDVITHKNLKDVYAKVTLLDLCGINTRYEARLNAHGIFTPLQFLNAQYNMLYHQVFQSINGHYWYLRLRGWETDAIDFARKSYGQTYALKIPTANKEELSRLLMKLCEKMGRRLRTSGHFARGIHVSCLYRDGTDWHMGRKTGSSLYTTQELYRKAQWILTQQSFWKKVANLAVSCFELEPVTSAQMDLFNFSQTKQRNVSDALDRINDRYGEFTITPALMMGMRDSILDRIAFGSVKEMI